MREDILITGKGGFIGSHIRGGRAFRGDVASYESILRQAKGASGIVHLAAVSDWRLCEGDPKECFKINLIYLADVLDVALKRGIWVLFISTFQVKEPNLYGLTKLAGEELCRLYSQKGLRVKILRLPIVYGPGDKPQKVVAKFISEIKSGRKPVIQTRRKFYFAYVEDVARMIENEVAMMNFQPGKKYSLHDLAAGVKKCLQKGRNT